MKKLLEKWAILPTWAKVVLLIPFAILAVIAGVIYVANSGSKLIIGGDAPGGLSELAGGIRQDARDCGDESKAIKDGLDVAAGGAAELREEAGSAALTTDIIREEIHRAGESVVRIEGSVDKAIDAVVDARRKIREARERGASDGEKGEGQGN